MGEKVTNVLVNQFNENFNLKTLDCLFSGLKNDALMHREGLKGYHKIDPRMIVEEIPG